MNKRLNIVTVLRTGGDFSISDVRLLTNHLRKYANDLEINIYCLSNITSIPIRLYGIYMIPIPTSKKGWWAKLELFNPELEHLRPFIYMDLDTAIVGNYSELIPENENKFIALSDFYKPTKSASALMWFPTFNKKVKAVWEQWCLQPSAWIKLFRGDQDFIFNTISADSNYQNITNTITSFKPNRMHLKTLPKDVSVVCFHGQPRIPKAAKTIEWVKQYVEEVK